MPNLVSRKNIFSTIGPTFTLASADDLNGTVDGTQYLTLKARQRAIIIQHNNGTLGTVGVDVVEISKASGAFYADPTLMLAATADKPGAAVANAALNAAGVEPVNMAVFKSGPHGRSTRLRLGRGGAGALGTTWVTGAPSVTALVIG